MCFLSCCLQQEDTRQKLVISDNKVRQLETQVCEEKLASADGRKVCTSASVYLGFHILNNLFLSSTVLHTYLQIEANIHFPLCMLEQRTEEFQHEIKGLRKELESEKVQMTNSHYDFLKLFLFNFEGLHFHILLYDYILSSGFSYLITFFILSLMQNSKA